MELNYYRTLIAVADDCPVKTSTVPTSRGAQQTVAVLQYELLAKSAHRHTQEDVLFHSWLKRQEPAPAEAEHGRLRSEFFAKPQACLRASPLPKKYGFGLLFDQQGRVALCPMESAEYQRIVGGQTPGIKIVQAMRSSRQ
jgi:hypothetical protein